MSLDVYLYLKGSESIPTGEAIFIREDGRTNEISREEWDKRFPNKEPFIVQFPSDNECVYSANITHNLNIMADEAGIYKYLWRPEYVGVSKAEQLIEPLESGLKTLKNKPDYFKMFNPENGWGSYEGLVYFVEKYLEACKEFPEAEVSVSR